VSPPIWQQLVGICSVFATFFAAHLQDRPLQEMPFAGANPKVGDDILPSASDDEKQSPPQLG